MIDRNLYTRNRGHLFRQYAEQLIEWATKKKPPTSKREPEWKNVDSDVEMDALGSLGGAMQEARQVGFSGKKDWNRAHDVIRKRLKDGQKYPRLDANDVLHEGEAAVLVRTEYMMRVEYVHHLVQEFFAAYALRDKEEWHKDLVQRCEDLDWWWQALFFLGGILNPHHHADYNEFVTEVLADG